MQGEELGHPMGKLVRRSRELESWFFGLTWQLLVSVGLGYQEGLSTEGGLPLEKDSRAFSGRLPYRMES